MHEITHRKSAINRPNQIDMLAAVRGTTIAEFTTAPVPAIQKVIAQAGWTIEDVDLFEINEAFACVTMFPMRDLGIPGERVNVHGAAAKATMALELI